MKQRPIKFRVWNSDRDCWVTNLTYCIDDFSTTQKEWHIVEQFTGLHDRNGKEIYEGDILCDEEYNTWQWRGVVKYSHGVFGAEWLTNVESQSMVGSWGQKHNLRKLDDDILERQLVVGNIHENPELLTQPTP